MTNKQTRRSFVKGALAAAGAASLAMSLEEQVLLAQAGPADKPKGPLAPGSKNTLPTGKLGDLKISRLVMGGNLIGGFAHSRDLLYVSTLLRHYFTEEKILETLELAEAHGINAINTNPGATKVIQRYRKERKGKIRWIVQGYPSKKDKLTNVKRSIDAGADAIYIQGNVADRFVAAGELDVIDEVVRYVQAQGLPAGVGGHSLDVPKACEKASFQPDFYVKTLHRTDYWSTRRPDQTQSVIKDRHDNFWCADPKATIDFMKTVKKPWIAYKVLAAGAIHPQRAFPHALNGGADFLLVGMFDFQIDEDVRIIKQALANAKRTRPWRS